MRLQLCIILPSLFSLYTSIVTKLLLAAGSVIEANPISLMNFEYGIFILPFIVPIASILIWHLSKDFSGKLRWIKWLPSAVLYIDVLIDTVAFVRSLP